MTLSLKASFNIPVVIYLELPLLPIEYLIRLPSIPKFLLSTLCFFNSFLHILYKTPEIPFHTPLRQK